MYLNKERPCCQNCEHLRIDNFCLVKGKYILTKNDYKIRECEDFSLILLNTVIPETRQQSKEIIAKLLNDE